MQEAKLKFLRRERKCWRWWEVPWLHFWATNTSPFTSDPAWLGHIPDPECCWHHNPPCKPTEHEWLLFPLPGKTWCGERQVPGITLQFWSLSDTNLSFRCKEGSYQVPWQPVICWLAHTPCFISSVPGSPKWCHFCASLWAVFFPSPDPHPRAPVEVWGVWRSYTALPESRELMPPCVSPLAPWKTILINEAFS